MGFNSGFKGLTNLVTTWIRVLPEKPTGPQQVNEFLAFYGSRKFITALTIPLHLSLS